MRFDKIIKLEFIREKFALLCRIIEGETRGGAIFDTPSFC
jgi:hypothetical protein